MYYAVYLYKRQKHFKAKRNSVLLKRCIEAIQAEILLGEWDTIQILFARLILIIVIFANPPSVSSH